MCTRKGLSKSKHFKANESCTIIYQNHKACSYANRIVCSYDKYVKEISKIKKPNQDAVYSFIENILKEVEWCKHTIRTQFNKPMYTNVEDFVKQHISTCVMVNLRMMVGMMASKWKTTATSLVSVEVQPIHHHNWYKIRQSKDTLSVPQPTRLWIASYYAINWQIHKER